MSDSPYESSHLNASSSSDRNQNNQKDDEGIEDDEPLLVDSSDDEISNLFDVLVHPAINGSNTMLRDSVPKSNIDNNNGNGKDIENENENESESENDNHGMAASFSSLHSGSNRDGKRSRRRQRLARVKHYNEDGDEIQDQALGTDRNKHGSPNSGFSQGLSKTSSTRNHQHQQQQLQHGSFASGSSSYSSFDASSHSISSRNQKRSSRMKRFTSRPSTIDSSSGEDEDEEEAPDNDNGNENTTREVLNSNESTHHENSLSGTDGASRPTTATSSAALWMSHVSDNVHEKNDNDDDDDNHDARLASEEDSENEDVVTATRRARESIQHHQAAAMATAAMVQRNLLKPRNDKTNEASSSKSKNDEDKKANHYAPLPQSKEKEDASKRQAAALASAAILRKGQLKHTEPVKNTTVSANTTTDETTEELQAVRRMVLEQRKRKLEALVNGQYDRNFSNTAGNKVGTGGRPESALEQNQNGVKPERTVNFDVYTGEAIGDMPSIDSILKKSNSDKGENNKSTPSLPQRAMMTNSDSSSIDSTTEYDTPANKAYKNRNLILVLVLLMLIGVGLGVYFGAFFEKDNDDENGENPNGNNISLNAPDLTTPIPTASRESIMQPSLRPTLGFGLETATPTLQSTNMDTSNTGEPSIQDTDQAISTVRPSISHQAGRESNQINPILLDRLSGEWPMDDAARDSDSAQFRALEWLSSTSESNNYTIEQLKQRYALATLFYSTNGENWKNNDFWLSNETECIWYMTTGGGAQCDEEGRFTSLKLNFNDLDGTLPAELGLLSTSLTSLDIIRDYNGPSLSGSLPSEIGMLLNLEFLNLEGQDIQGSIPTEFGLLSNLRRLQLQDNQMVGSLPSEFGLLTRLRQLDLSSNSFVGSLPTELGKMAILQEFFADSNSFTQIPTEIGDLTFLTNLDISGNRLQGSIPTELGGLRNLVRLKLSSNLFSSTIPSTFGNLPLIRDLLDLSDNALTGSIPESFGRLFILRRLILHSNQLTGEVPSTIRNLDRLRTIRLESNRLEGEIPEDVCSTFHNALPVFVTDCVSKVFCSCCSHCCEGGDCRCEVENIPELQFLCERFP